MRAERGDPEHQTPDPGPASQDGKKTAGDVFPLPLWIHSPVSTDVLLEDGLVGAAPSAALKAVGRMDSGWTLDWLVCIKKEPQHPRWQDTRIQNAKRPLPSPASAAHWPDPPRSQSTREPLGAAPTSPSSSGTLQEMGEWIQRGRRKLPACCLLPILEGRAHVLCRMLSKSSINIHLLI